MMVMVTIEPIRSVWGGVKENLLRRSPQIPPAQISLCSGSCIRDYNKHVTTIIIIVQKTSNTVENCDICSTTKSRKQRNALFYANEHSSSKKNKSQSIWVILKLYCNINWSVSYVTTVNSILFTISTTILNFSHLK